MTYLPPEHMRAEVKRVIEKHSGRRVPLRRQTLNALKTYGHFHAEYGPLDLDFENQFKWMVINQQQYSQDFKEKLRTVIPKQKAIEKKVTQLVLKTYQDFERKYLSKNPEGTQGSWDKETNISDKIWKNEYYKLDNLTHEDSDLLERYRDQLLAKEIIKALGIRVSELRPNMRIGALSLATTKAYITHKNPLNRPYNQRLVTNNKKRLRPEHSISALIREFLWPIYYRKNKSSLKLPYERKIVPANVNRDVVTLNNFKNGDKVIGFGNPKYHRYLSQNSFKNLAKMTPTEAFYLSKNWNNRVPLFRDPFNRTKTVYRHDLKFVTLNMNPRYNEAAVKIQSRYKGGKYRNTQIKIANAAEKKSAAANRAAQRARAKFNQAKKFRDVITKRRKKSPSKNNNSPSKRRTLRANAATARATASKRRSP